MALFNWKKEAVKPQEKTKYVPVLNGPLKGFSKKVSEQFKGEVRKEETVISKDVGEEHPFDMAQTEGLYKEYGPVTGAVDKVIDFVVGPGFFIASENEKAKQLIEEFMRRVNFDTFLRSWVKEALVKGTGFAELALQDKEPVAVKVLDAKWMFIKRDDKGKIKEFNQVKSNSRGGKSISKDNTIPFKPEEVAWLPLNKIGDMAYGLGMVSPALSVIDNLLSLEEDMHVLMKRKANAPIHAKIGNNEHFPNPSDVTDFGAKLETLNKKHEWATDWLVDMKVLDFGDIAGKFTDAFKHDEDMLFFTFQIPEVLMGRGNIAEGLAEVQMDAFERKIQSIQAEIEKSVEQQIFRRILEANGLQDEHVEFEWGQPSSSEKNERIQKITELLKNPMLSPTLRGLLEAELATLMGFNEKELETPEEERETEEQIPVPIIPGQNRREIYLGELVE